MTEQAATEKLSPEYLVSLYEITTAISSSLDFDVVLNRVMDSVMEITQAQRGFLMIAEDEDDEPDMSTLVYKNVDKSKLEEEGYSTTIVNEVVSTKQPLLTNNAQFDTRFGAGQSIIMRGLRAIMCVPMLAKGRLVGVIYVDSSMKTGVFQPDDLNLLEAVAGQAGIAIENARLYAVAVEKGRMEKELQMAAEVQQSLLPQKMPKVPGYEIAPIWKAARETAGDFYDAFPLGDDRFGVVIADVSDKGASAALFMAVARTMIRSNASVGFSPIDIIKRTNDLILEDADSDMFVTVYHSHFETGGHSIHVNAGHNPPLIYRQSRGDVEFLPRGGRAIGWFPDNPVEEIHIELEPGDIIVYYTDGVTEAENPQLEHYGEERLSQVIVTHADHSAYNLLAVIVDDVEIFCNGQPPFDDMTLVVVRYLG